MYRMGNLDTVGIILQILGNWIWNGNEYQLCPPFLPPAFSSLGFSIKIWDNIKLV